MNTKTRYPDALVAFVRSRLDHDLGESDAVHLDGCQRRADGCDCMWPDQIRDAIAGKRVLLDEYEQHVHGPVPGHPRYVAGWLDALHAVVCVLAGEWWGHPDFRPEWKTEAARTQETT